MITDRKRDLVLSVGIIALVVVFALVGLATDRNWPKILRVSLAFLAYSGVLFALLFALLRFRGHSLSSQRPIPFYWFAFAGAAAGMVSGVVRPQFRLSILLAGTLAAAFILGSVHWFALRTWRSMRPRR
jgi:hypothetical protein